MPAAWMPGLIRDPGKSAGYPGGRIRMQWCKHHDTAGTNSYNICKYGRPGYKVSLCQILLPKVGVPWQFCEIDSSCADSGNWNGWGPGLEVERLGHHQELSPDQVYWLGEIGRWLESEWGIPNVQYRGSQFGAEGFHGHVNHSDIAYNPDGLTVAEWDLVAGKGPEPGPDWEAIARAAEQQEDDEMDKFTEARLTDGRLVTAIRGQDTGVYYLIKDTDGNYESGAWKQVPGSCRFSPVVAATDDGGATLKIVGDDWSPYEAILSPGGHDFGQFVNLGGVVAGLSNYG